MQDKVDIALGYAAAGIGTTGAAFQMWGHVGNALVIGLNVFVAIGGLYLIWLRSKIAKMDLAKAEERAARLDREADGRADERATNLDREADGRADERNARLDREADERAK